jgi:hypothetical protein
VQVSSKAPPATPPVPISKEEEAVALLKNIFRANPKRLDERFIAVMLDVDVSVSLMMIDIRVMTMMISISAHVVVLVLVGAGVARRRERRKRRFALATKDRRKTTRKPN